MPGTHPVQDFSIAKVLNLCYKRSCAVLVWVVGVRMIAGSREPDRRVYQLHAEICKVLAHPARLEMLDLLRDGPLRPSELAERLGVSRSNVSQHLAVMHHKGLLRRVRVQRAVVYSVTDPRLFDACRNLRELVREQLRAGGRLAELAFGKGAQEAEQEHDGATLGERGLSAGAA
jgi:ArsR family transcriptional regulator